MRAACVVSREPDRLHYRLGARHMEGNFVQSGNLPQSLDIVGDDGMVGADDGTKIADALGASGNAFLVEVIPEKIDAVRTGEIVQDIAVKIADSDAGRRCKNGAGREVLTNDAAVPERERDTR